MTDPTTLELTDGPQADELDIETHELDGRDVHVLVITVGKYAHRYRITELDLTTLHMVTGNMLQIDGYLNHQI